MPSNALRAFDQNCQDIESLLKIAVQQDYSNDSSSEVVSKSAIVLITSFWEAYCEDVAAEGLAHLIDNIDDIGKLPKKLKQDLAADLKADRDDLAILALAGDGWRKVLLGRLGTYTATRNYRFNSPKPAQIDELFQKALGITAISNFWHWEVSKTKRSAQPSTMTAEESRKMLTEYIELRGAIAHRGDLERVVTVWHAQQFYELVKRLVSKTGGAVSEAVERLQGFPCGV
jgi:hypothetical protein